MPDLGPGTNLDDGPKELGRGPLAGGFESGVPGGGPAGPMAGSSVQSGSTAPTATDESAKAEAQAPGNVDGRDSTYQSFGAARGLASGGGSGGKGGPDLSGLSGLMAKLLGSGDDEAEKQRRAGIMQFAGDQRGPAAQDSLLDRSVNLFKRVSDAYQHKNRSGAI
jgi:hypothetical protein